VFAIVVRAIAVAAQRGQGSPPQRQSESLLVAVVLRCRAASVLLARSLWLGIAPVPREMRPRC